MDESKDINEIANQILEDNPDPAVQFRLLRDVLQFSNVSEILKE